MPLRGVVHFGDKYPNAFWDGQRMVFGDGDGQVLGVMTGSLDVIGHELGHGVTEAEAGLEYWGQRELDTAQLPEEEAREIEALVRRADFASLAAASPMRGRQPDRFQYELTIEDDAGRRELAVSEERVPEKLRPLLDRVRAQGSG